MAHVTAAGRTPWHYSKACVIADASSNKSGGGGWGGGGGKHAVYGSGGVFGSDGGDIGVSNKFRSKAEIKSRRAGLEKSIPTYDAPGLPNSAAEVGHLLHRFVS